MSKNKVSSVKDKTLFLGDLIDRQTSEGLWTSSDLSLITRFKTLFGIATLNEDKLMQEIEELAPKDP